MRVQAGIVIALIVGAAIRVATVWDDLPPSMATHFDLRGEPDAWASRGAFIAGYAALTCAMAALFLLMPKLVRRIPVSMINLPRRDYWLAPERREQTFAEIGVLFGWFAVGIVTLLVAVLELVLRANLARRSLETVEFLSVLAAFFVFVAIWLGWFLRHFLRTPDRA